MKDFVAQRKKCYRAEKFVLTLGLVTLFILALFSTLTSYVCGLLVFVLFPSTILFSSSEREKLKWIKGFVNCTETAQFTSTKPEEYIRKRRELRKLIFNHTFIIQVSSICMFLIVLIFLMYKLSHIK